MGTDAGGDGPPEPEAMGQLTPEAMRRLTPQAIRRRTAGGTVPDSTVSERWAGLRGDPNSLARNSLPDRPGEGE